ncbi:MAG: hypothetical protein U5R06_23185 [candidate division KSB1 bacterium]|nr:hypothetical protein [candidate division KSB1 bacterium]
MTLTLDILLFFAASGLIAWFGAKLAMYADLLADRTGLGEAVTGTVFLGFVTALPGLVTAALQGHPALAISSAIGGIAIQTVFLALADITYTKANLEHAAASVANMIQTIILIILLTLVLTGLANPETSVASVHPMTPLLILSAGGGFALVYRASQEPMWNPRMTTFTVEDTPDTQNISASLLKLVLGFIAIAILVTAAGALVAHTAGNIT